MTGTVIPYHSDLHRDISLWLQANRNLTPEERFLKVKMMLYLANLDDDTLLHYAANCFTCIDAMVVNANKLPSELIQSAIGGGKVVEHKVKQLRVKAGRARADNDPAHIALEVIREKEYPNAKHRFHIRGHTTKFVTDMHTKYPAITSRDSIKNLVTRLNKENGITQRKK